MDLLFSKAFLTTRQERINYNLQQSSILSSVAMAECRVQASIMMPKVQPILTIYERTVTTYNPKYVLNVAGEYFPLFCFSLRLRCGSLVAENDDEAMTSEECCGQGHRYSLDRQSDGGEGKPKASERDLNKR